jgi:hypothetical protein
MFLLYQRTFLTNEYLQELCKKVLKTFFSFLSLWYNNKKGNRIRIDAIAT